MDLDISIPVQQQSYLPYPWNVWGKEGRHLGNLWVPQWTNLTLLERQILILEVQINGPCSKMPWKSFRSGLIILTQGGGERGSKGNRPCDLFFHDLHNMKDIYVHALVCHMVIWAYILHIRNSDLALYHFFCKLRSACLFQAAIPPATSGAVT